MGKEMKIGLAVVGVLLLGFSALLVRRVITSDAVVGEPVAPRATPAYAPAAEEKPTVVMAQRESVEKQRAASRNSWQRHAEEASGESSGDVPRASYMPAEAAPPDSAPRELHGRENEATEDNDEAARQPIRPRRSNPFDVQPPARSEPEVEEASAIEPVNEPPREGARNPLRRTSAQVPLNESEPDPSEPSELDSSDARVDAEAIVVEASDSEPQVALPRDEDAPAVADEPGIPDNIPNVPSAAAPQRSAWRGAVETASNRAVEPQTLENGKYRVQPNDSLWIVSEKVYGTGRYFKAIYEHNRAMLPNADKLTVGTIIAVPPVALLEQNYPGLCPKQRKSALVKHRTVAASTRQRIAGSNVYVVEEGDTLFDIARYELGKASRWAEIYDLNRDALGEDFDYLQPGTELAMPSKAHERDSITRQRDAGIQR